MGKIWDPADARKVPANVNERVKKNLEEGKGFSIKKIQQEGAKAGTTSAEAQNDTKIYISLNSMDGRLWSYSEKNRSLVGDWSF